MSTFFINRNYLVGLNANSNDLSKAKKECHGYLYIIIVVNIVRGNSNESFLLTFQISQIGIVCSGGGGVDYSCCFA